MILKFLNLKFDQLSWLEKMWLVGPVVIWFSYQPLIRFGQDSTSYYELSFVTLYLLVLALVGLPVIWRERRNLIRSKSVMLTAAFVMLSIVTLLWTPNLLRGVLTTGIIGLLFLVFLGAIAEREKFIKLVPALTKLLVVSAVILSILALIQVIAGIWLPRTDTLLCAGCIADQFGFVRPNVFTIEPQFLGSLFLAPLLVLLHLLLKGNFEKRIILSFIAVSMGLFLTLSRGAVFAFITGMVVLFVINSRVPKKILYSISLLFSSFVLTLLIQGTAASLNPRVDTTFYSAISASINQLTLGIVKLPDQTPTVQTDPSETEPAFNGYVPESTDTRLSLSNLAIQTWAQSPFTILLGVGVGGSGVAVHEAFPTKIDAREIVQNEYIELLLEYGLVGVSLFVVLLAGFFYKTRKAIWVWAFAVAYLVQWNFFSGYPNTLHIYFVLFALYAKYGELSKQQPIGHRVEAGQKR